MGQVICGRRCITTREDSDDCFDDLQGGWRCSAVGTVRRILRPLPVRESSVSVALAEVLLGRIGAALLGEVGAEHCNLGECGKGASSRLLALIDRLDVLEWRKPCARRRQAHQQGCIQSGLTRVAAPAGSTAPLMQT